MVDFDELITKAEPLADRVADRWDYALVDEFQDVNAVQYDLLKRLAEPHGNFFAVGDDEQSIFAWTGADPYVLERFRRDYDVVPIILDKNRRCSRQIFETARRVLAQNPQLFQKQLTADQESPYEVVAHGFRDEHEEATWLLRDLQSDHAAGLSWGDYAILYRKHRVGEHSDFRVSARALAERRAARDPDTRKLWRLIYQLENLRTLPRSHGTLPAVIEEILSQTVGPYRNKLEERHDELTDPAALPEAVELAVRLRSAKAISFAPRGGVEIALRGMLAAAGFRNLPTAPAGTVIDADALTVFKALQLLDAEKLDTTLDRYVTFDFETTDN